MHNFKELVKEVDDIALKHSFQNACSDNEFKEYVYNLNKVLRGGINL